MTMKSLASSFCSPRPRVRSRGIGRADTSLAKQMEECFRQHGHLMDKPAVRNVRACWMAHAY